MSKSSDQNLPSSLRELWDHINIKRRKQFLILFLLMIIASFAEVISIGAVVPFLSGLTSPETIFDNDLIQPIVNFFGYTEPKQILLPLTIMFSIAAILSGTARLALLWYKTRFAHAVGADFSFDIYKRTLYQPYDVHISRNSSETIAAISTKANLAVYQIVIPVLTILSSIVIIVMIMAVLTYIDPNIALFTFLGFGIIYLFVILATRKYLLKDSSVVSLEQNRVIKALQEGLGGIRDILIDGTQSTYCKIFRKADLPLRRSLANIQITAGTPRFAIEALGMILIAVLAFNTSQSEAGILGTIPVLGAMALGAQRLLPVLQQAYSGWTLIKGGQATLLDILAMLNQKMPKSFDQKNNEEVTFNKGIRFENIKFKYKSEDNFVLNDISFLIEKGDRIGFIGKTGSGKSTLLDIIMGLLVPTSGEMLVDGQKIKLNNARSWQSRIAHVPQNIFLSDKSINENIAFGIETDELDLERIKNSAQKAQIADTINEWSQGYETIIGERGVKISGGQRQRIGIARALYKKADLIVFDEATSALDDETEKTVMQAIENLSAELTLIIVAHRKTTLQSCNKIIELKDGEVNFLGNYSQMVGHVKMK